MKKQLVWLISSFLVGIGCFLFLQHDNHSAAFHDLVPELTPQAVVAEFQQRCDHSAYDERGLLDGSIK